MKTILYIIATIFVFNLFDSCKKTENIKFDGGGINVTNAVVSGTTLTLLSNNTIASTPNTIILNGFNFMPLASGQNLFTIGVPAVASTITAPAIPAIVYYTNTLAVDNSTNYSLFLTGTSSSAVDNVLIKENYTSQYADSVCAVRFINLAPGSSPISVNIKGNGNGSEVANLAYKSYSNFKQYPARSVNKTILFEIRDAASGTLLYPTNGAGFALTIPYFHNVTLAYRGTGTNVGIIVVNNN